MSNYLTRRIGVALAAATTVYVAACASESGPTAPAGLQPTGELVTVSPQTVMICVDKNSQPGTYYFSQTGLTGTSYPSDVGSTGSFSITLAPGATTDACVVAYTRYEGESGGITIDPEAFPTYTHTLNDGTVLTSIVVSPLGLFTVDPSFSLSGLSASMVVNGYHGSVATFLIEQVHLGCTYTMGWYKNKGAAATVGRSLAGVSFSTWLNTSPRGDARVILAHQYITALLNVEGGAYAPPAVADAMEDAAAYFAGTLSLSRDQLTTIAGLLDQFNNGLAPSGPPHCDD